ITDVRHRFSALAQGTVFFDGPGGTQVPDEVIEAIAGYLRESNANLGGAFERSRRSDRLVGEGRRAAAGFLGCGAEEVVFGANMTTLNFALSRSLGRELEAGDEIVVTKLDHDGNVSPWLELSHDLGIVVRFAELRDDTTLDLEHLASMLSERTRVVAFPWASNAVGTLVDVAAVAELAHSVGALAWVDAVHYAPHGPIDVAAAGADVLLCSPYKFYGPHLGVAFARADLLERWRPYKVRPSPGRRGSGRDRPLQHRGRGRSAPGGAGPALGLRSRRAGYRALSQTTPPGRRCELDASSHLACATGDRSLRRRLRDQMAVHPGRDRGAGLRDQLLHGRGRRPHTRRLVVAGRH